MRYISTRGKSPAVYFQDVLLRGLAPDGGLYLPDVWPQLRTKQLKSKLGNNPDYSSLAVEVIWPFVEGSMEKSDLSQLVARAYSSFNADDIVPLKRIRNDLWIAELFHGPTLAFKDIALQLVGELFQFQLQKNSEKITIVGATSGDTGSAAIEACRDREAMDIFILHPHERTSEVQRMQMTSVTSKNVFNIAIQGNFDDCQDLVKAMFADEKFREQINMSAVNSINWARVMAQIVYYWWVSIQITDGKPVNFCVPSGNFGNVFAGYGAHLMGLPVERFLVASNTNDVLDRFFRTGQMQLRDVAPTFSPSMDIQISSNFERLLFESLDRDPEKLRNLFNELKENNGFRIGNDTLTYIRNDFKSGKASEEKVKDTISRIHKASNIILDPHTAVGFYASASELNFDVPMVNLGTAHPAKFSKAVIDAIGFEPEIPDRLKNIINKKEKFTQLENNSEALISFIRKYSNV